MPASSLEAEVEQRRFPKPEIVGSNPTGASMEQKMPILYADDTPATQASAYYLTEHGVSFTVRFEHDLPQTPVLDTELGMFVGFEGIKSFADRHLTMSA